METKCITRYGHCIWFSTKRKNGKGEKLYDAFISYDSSLRDRQSISIASVVKIKDGRWVLRQNCVDRKRVHLSDNKFDSRKEAVSFLVGLYHNVVLQFRKTTELNGRWPDVLEIVDYYMEDQGW